ncbi:MAG: pyruvate, phosphate dikinase, partial [Gammaproteobacteria bacterium]|nr:pyruvate, phosphate dikinase [Gammaproteobacteria bacterium]
MESPIYYFTRKTVTGHSDLKDVLGGKGANLAGMAKLGVPVPDGFTIATEECMNYLDAQDTQKATILNDVVSEVITAMNTMTYDMGLNTHPLVSVRSGARVSMPGMMDTLLNIGMTTSNMDYWVERLGAWTAYDCRRRQIQMYANVVEGVAMGHFELALNEAKSVSGVD